MNGALAELVWRELRGSLVRRARLLRQPRYLVSFLATLAYFGLVMRPSFSSWGRHGGRGAGGAIGGGGMAMSAAAADDLSRLLVFGASLAIVVAATAMWIFASSKPALALGEADLNLLLPAPLPRRKIVELSIWRQQAGLLAGALVVTLARGYGPPSVRLGRIVTTWGVLLLLGLHSRGVNLWKARLGEIPAGAASRRIGLAVALGVAYWGALAAGLWAAVRQAAAAGGLTAGSGGGLRLGAGGGPGGGGATAVWAVVHRLAAAPPALVSALLAPARWIAVAILGGGARLAGVGPAQDGAWLAAVGFLALAVAANYEWVVRSRVRFEDASLERARRLGTRRRRQPALPAATSRERRREPFPLGPLGPPELAIYWKNLLATQRTPLQRRLALALLPGLALWLGTRLFGAPLAVLGSAGATGFMLMALPPIVAGLNQRHDLRGDLLHLEVVRPWPLRGWRLVAAELLAPATTFFTWTLAGFGLVAASVLAAGHQLADGAPLELGRLGRLLVPSGAGGGGGGGGPAAALLTLALAVLIAGLPLTLLSVAAQNLLALVLPGWTRMGNEPRGASLTGARMLALAGHLVVLLLGVVPAALAVAAVVLGAAWAGVRPAAWQAPVLALVAGVPLLLEVGLVVQIAGARWDRLDPSLELLNPEE